MKFLWMAMAMFMLASCGDNSSTPTPFPGEGLPELTTSQKVQMKNFNREVVDFGVVAQSLDKNSSAKTDKLSNTGTEIFNRVQQAVKDGECFVTTVGEPVVPGGPTESLAPAPAGEKQTYKVEVKGNKDLSCPVEYSMTIEAENKASSNSMTVKSRQVTTMTSVPTDNKSLEISSISEIQSYENVKNFNLVASGSEAARTLTATMDIVNDTTVKTRAYGTIRHIHSIRGPATLHLNKDGVLESTDMNIQIVLDQTYPDFRAVGVVEAKGSFDADEKAEEELELKYYVNGRVVEVKEFVDVFGNSFNMDDLQTL
ncbi:MAG: hypothetical protein KDD33_07775 [Bdellovibrionales bacterium]|nr:hypothetical protein [Bdellovibrionales bacterium]